MVDEPLRSLRLLHDALAVILADGAAQLVVVHGRPVLAFAPETGHAHAVLDLEDAARPIQPADGRSVHGRLRQQLLQELPQMDMRPVGWRRRRCRQRRRRARRRPPIPHHVHVVVLVVLHFFDCKTGNGSCVLLHHVTLMLSTLT